jgi:hypothetical protein
MRIWLDPRAAFELENQITYLIEQGALVAATQLKDRCDGFLEEFLRSILAPANTSPNGISGRPGFRGPGS